jgi:hypothetical protein
MKIAIIGAGWYGCHLSISLLQKGHEVKIFEKEGHTISGASRYNQNRLHQGFHYPRDYETRRQSLEGFSWFVEHYGHLTKEIKHNVYGVADTQSLVDFETYKQVMTATGLIYNEAIVSKLEERFINVSGMINTTERLILNHQATKYFDDVLSKHLTLNTYIDLSNELVLGKLKNEYDYVIDCTWGTARKITGLDYYYEPCIYFYYRNRTDMDFAFTLMDGKFFSIYPYENDIFTLTSVANTPIGQTFNRNEIAGMFREADGYEYIKNKRKSFESEVLEYYPEFLNDFEYIEPVYSLKTKLVSGTDFRGCVVKSEDNLISVFSGKIDTLHIAENLIFEIIS